MRGGAGLLALPSLREDGVNFVNKDDGGLLGARDAEERAHELLALASLRSGLGLGLGVKVKVKVRVRVRVRISGQG